MFVGMQDGTAAFGSDVDEMGRIVCVDDDKDHPDLWVLALAG